MRSDIDDHGGVLVAVADSGTGIAQKDLNRIFEAFFTTKASGMGMGLFICRSIIEFAWRAPMGGATLSSWHGILRRPSGRHGG